MTQVHRPRPERADSPELAAFRQLKAAQPELAGAVDMQVELFVMQRRVQARLSTPWLEFDAVWLARQLAEGLPILRFEEIPFEWGEFRTLFRQASEVLRRYDLLEQADQDAIQGLIRAGRPTRDDVACWYEDSSDHRVARPKGVADAAGGCRAGARARARGRSLRAPSRPCTSASTSRPGRYGRVRMLLTGDLNTDSQRALLDDYAGNRIEFQCDVAKACHHGSDDVWYGFLSAMRPAVTVISSGDSEGHDHPRPGVVAASATTGYLEIKDDHLVTPLVYSTELARSLNLGRPTGLTIADPAGNTVVARAALGTVTISAEVTKAGDLNPTTVSRVLAGTFVVSGLIYGLVNVRTDGETILCATLNEKDNSWQIKKVISRF